MPPGRERQRPRLRLSGVRPACRTLGLRQIRSRLHTPRTIGKAERLIQTLCREWAYSMPFQNSEERNHWLPCDLAIDHHLWKHSALGWRSFQQRLFELVG